MIPYVILYKKSEKFERKRKKLRKRKGQINSSGLLHLATIFVIVSSFIFGLFVCVSYWHLCGNLRIGGYLKILWEIGVEEGRNDKVSGIYYAKLHGE